MVVQMALQGQMVLKIWDVEHGACAMLQHQIGNYFGRLAMIDSGCTGSWPGVSRTRSFEGAARG